MKKYSFVLLTVLAAAFAAACGRLSTSAVESNGHVFPHTIVILGTTPGATSTPGETPTPTPGESPTATPTGTPDVTPTGTPDVTPTPDMSPTPTPNVSPTPVPTPCAGDIDCDGIPDPVDNIPCDGFLLKITNVGVSSATLEFNGTTIATSNDFPSTAEIDIQLNPVTGANTLSMGGKVSGSPSDSFHFVIVDSLGTVYLDQTITRTNGAPHDVTIPVTINVTCQ